MIELPHGNKCSRPAIHPKKYKLKDAQSVSKWYVHYRFYCPAYPDGKMVKVVKEINTFEKHSEKIIAAETLRTGTMASLLKGFDPVKKELVGENSFSFEIHPDTPAPAALNSALDKIKLERRTRAEIKSHLVHITTAITRVKMDKTPISEMKKRHVKLILEQIAKDKGKKWTPNMFNTFRKYLSILFRELVELEAMEFNPTAGISKQKTVKKIRRLLTKEERETISNHLSGKFPAFWQFIQIFFHSGARITEILKVKTEDVDLQHQTVKITIIKGSDRKEVLKVIKTVALPYWEAAVAKAKPGQYLFARSLRPGDKLIRPEQVTRRWKRIVVDGLGISSALYSLKHLASDEMSRLLSLEHAQRQNSHTTTGTTRIYAINQKEREDAEIRDLNNKFA